MVTNDGAELRLIPITIEHAACPTTFKRIETLCPAFSYRLSAIGFGITPTEYNLLVLLSGHAGKVLTHRMILRTIWGPHSENDINTLRVFVTQLRRKIEATPGNPRLIMTEPGVGYRFRSPEAKE